ncbi:hypothetical protein BEWA_029320 [Theileria equi strain WA]|uniref:Signal peptide containing protein n=1 Tax=Theileria equi strain WA TaxID=1537102 RepID=L0AWW3_THEEQ|nr:hypothetical protein BEWA_029320 [Theileria equi strain WA]AFZ80082.1 hypothetical protein BEWA_029320 [Theileria equi strain WA]|eukprot:XP_004829748.1 hypothetical protein BEWA_029320 [Theileria equi strain WA]
MKTSHLLLFSTVNFCKADDRDDVLPQVFANCPILGQDYNNYPLEVEDVVVTSDARDQVTMDIMHLDRETFHVNDCVSYGVHFGEVLPRTKYKVTRVTYCNEVLFIAPESWECNRTTFYTDGTNMLVIMWYRRGELRDQLAVYKRGDSSWQEVDQMAADEIIFDMVKEPPEHKSKPRRFVGA